MAAWSLLQWLSGWAGERGAGEARRARRGAHLKLPCGTPACEDLASGLNWGLSNSWPERACRPVVDEWRFHVATLFAVCRFGSVTAAHTGSRAPGTEALRQFNFPPHVRATIRTAPLHVLAAEAAGAAADAAAAGQAGGAEAQAQQGQPEGAGAAGAAEPATAADGAAAMLVDADGGAGSSAAQKPAAAGDLAAAAAQEPQAGAERGWAPYTSCIIAAPALSPTAALDAVLPLLAPSTPFAVYSLWTQPLAEAMSELQVRHLTVFYWLACCCSVLAGRRLLGWPAKRARGSLALAQGGGRMQQLLLLRVCC